VDPDVEVPITVRVPDPNDATFPNALVKGTAPPNPPPPLPPPKVRPESPPGRVHPPDVALEMEMVRAVAGPDDEAAAPKTWTQSPTARLDAPAVTV
jgi:hypothetical protein